MPMYLTESGAMRMHPVRLTGESLARRLESLKVPQADLVAPDGYTYVFDKNVKIPQDLHDPESPLASIIKPLSATEATNAFNTWSLLLALDIKGFGVLDDETFALDDYGLRVFDSVAYYRDPAFDETSLEDMISEVKSGFPDAFTPTSETATGVVYTPEIEQVINVLLFDPRFSDVYQRLVEKRAQTPY